MNMANIILSFLFFINAGFWNLTQDKVNVKLIVQGDDENMKNRIKSKMLNQLHLLSRINVVNDDNTVFVITINESLISCDGDVSGISMVSILTRKIVTSDNRKTEEILISNFNTIKKSDVETKCIDIIAKFDTHYFE
jgi:hypothetical protein